VRAVGKIGCASKDELALAHVGVAAQGLKVHGSRRGFEPSALALVCIATD
jgi:hypothetical protein